MTCDTEHIYIGVERCLRQLRGLVPRDSLVNVTSDRSLLGRRPLQVTLLCQDQWPNLGEHGMDVARAEDGALPAAVRHTDCLVERNRLIEAMVKDA